MRTYRELTEADRSGIGAQVEAQQRRVAERLASVRRVMGVASGKGGVGKSYVTAHLAKGLRALGLEVGVLDADLNAPTIPRLLGLGRGPLRVADGAVSPAVSVEGIRAFSMDLLLAAGEPLRWREPEGDTFVWRGALEAGALRELLADVAWGALDVLVVDLPPGAQCLEDLHRLVPALSGVLAVTIPSDESRDAVERALGLAVARGVPLLGVVENMASRVCSACGREEALFSGAAGATLAARFGAGLLIRLPFAPPASALERLARDVTSRLGLP